MLQRYSVRLRIYSWFMKYCHPKLASAGVIAGDVGRRQHLAQPGPSMENMSFGEAYGHYNYDPYQAGNNGFASG